MCIPSHVRMGGDLRTVDNVGGGVQGGSTGYSRGLFKLTNIPEPLECVCIAAVLQTHEANTNKLQDELEKATYRSWDFNAPLSIVDRTRKQIKTV